MFGAASIINDYAANPVNNYEMENYSIMREEGNPVCGDSIDVYIKLDQGNNIEKFSFAGYPSMITIAAASMLAETIEGHNINEVLNWDYSYMEDLGLEVSPRRKRSAVTALLAARNAIHKYINDGKQDDFDDLIEDE